MKEEVLHIARSPLLVLSLVNCQEERRAFNDLSLLENLLSLFFNEDSIISGPHCDLPNVPKYERTLYLDLDH